MDDRALSSWLLIVGSVAVGWWYWHLSPADKTARLAHTPMQQLVQGSPAALTTAPITGTDGITHYTDRSQIPDGGPPGMLP